MNVTGLSSNRFLVGNPIPVTFTETFPSTAVIRLTITREVTFTGQASETLPPIDLYPFGTSLTIDLAPYIKGLLPYPELPSDPVKTYQLISISVGYFPAGTQTESYNFPSKTFVRGWNEQKRTTAYTLPINEILRDSDLIPVWSGYPTEMYYMDVDSTIRSTPVVPPLEAKQMKLPSSCDPFYVRYLNSKGGYGFWMFDVWRWNSESESKGVIDRRPSPENSSLGFDREDTVTAEGRVRREFIQMYRALLYSPHVHVYNKFGQTWTHIEVQEGSYEENSFEDLYEVSIEFKLSLNISPALVW